MRSSIPFVFRSLIFLCALCTVLTSCDSQKETVASRGMQNLTAHYNILYNATELIKESERNIQLATIDDYDRVISVYKEPTELTAQSELKALDDAILKGNVIANEKSLSKYVDDAYFLIGRANHLKANFYNASEFFTYVYNTYPKEKELRQASLAWKARSLIASERFVEAESTLDTAFKYLDTEKESVGDIYAVRAQLHLYAAEDEQAITMLEQAVKNANNRQNKIRWTYLLAQLQQMTNKIEAAYANYTEVVKSNAPFDMAFNANLNRISIRNQESGTVQTRSQQLRALLKDDKNRDFIDQIYFQMAKSYAEEKDFEKAIEAYNASVRNSTKNLTQKGLSYLELAEIYLDQPDFIRAKTYYDSTLAVLPKTYPDYELILKKSQNLDLLADRLTIIAREDTLQMLASLPEADREVRIGALVREQTLRTINKASIDSVGSTLPGPTQALAQGVREGRFYFNNSAALTQGKIDFRRQWGARKLEDNWRRSQKSAADINNTVTPDQAIANNPFQQAPSEATVANIETIRRTFIEGMPLTTEQRLVSDQRIASAYYDIANYYRDVSLDTAAAVATYEKLLNRFPENENKLAVYYNLYRLYRDVNLQQSDNYKNRLLNDHPDSPFAKIILDPQYNQKSDEQELAFIKFYNEGYDLYVGKRYTDVLTLSGRYGQLFTGRPLPAQLDYLRALAVGRTQPLPQLEAAFKELITAYPEDKLIVPLVEQHLVYINANRAALEKRPVAIVDRDPNEEPFVEEPVSQPVITSPVVASNTNPVEPPLPTTSTTETPANPSVSISPTTDTPAAPVAENSFFVKEESTQFYFVVNVADPSIALASSRFGIGQFNRVNRQGESIKHQLRDAGPQNRLIFVGPFNGREAVQNYANSITPLMGQIMKIPAERYSLFYINEQNLNKITNKDLLDRYVEYFRTTY